VIMAQTACEIATDDLVTALLRLRRLPADLESWITARIERAATLRSNVLYNLYVALSGDDLKQGQPALWDAYERHIALRNAIVHKAKTHASKQQATDGCNMTEALIHHFETVRARVIGTPMIAAIDARKSQRAEHSSVRSQLIEAAFAAHRHPFCRAVKVQPESVAVVIVEFVFDVGGADLATASVAHRAGPTTHPQLDWGISRQASIGELTADHFPKLLTVHDQASVGSEQLHTTVLTTGRGTATGEQ
jgi:hypothetical protein